MYNESVSVSVCTVSIQENAYLVLSGCTVYQSKVWTVLCLYECTMKCTSENIQACVVVQVNAQVEVWDYSLWWWLCINISECTAVNKYTSCDMICTTAYTQSILIIIYSQRYVYSSIYSVMHWYSDVHVYVKYSSDELWWYIDIWVYRVI